jgi:hypothetical protein
MRNDGAVCMDSQVQYRRNDDSPIYNLIMLAPFSLWATTFGRDWEDAMSCNVMYLQLASSMESIARNSVET